MTATLPILLSGIATIPGALAVGGAVQASSFTSAPGADFNINPGPYPAPSGSTNRNTVFHVGDGNPTHGSQSGAIVIQTPSGLAIDGHGLGIDLLTSVIQAGTGPAVTMSGAPTNLATMVHTITTGGVLGTAQFSTTINGGPSNGGSTIAPQATAASILITGTGVTSAFGAGTYVLGTTYTQVVDLHINQWSTGYGAIANGYPSDIHVIELTAGGRSFTLSQTANSYFSIDGASGGPFFFRVFDYGNNKIALESKIQGTVTSWAFGGTPDANQDAAIQLVTATPVAGDNPASGNGWFWFDASGNFTVSNSSGVSAIRARPTASGAGTALVFGGSPGFTPGTNLAGGARCDLGALVSNQSAAFTLEAPFNTSILSVKQTGAGTTTLACGTNNLIVSSGSVTTVSCAQFGAACSFAVQFDAPDIYFDGRSHFRNLSTSTNYMTLDTTALSGGGSLAIATTAFGVFGAAPVAKPTITGSRGGNAALASLLTGLAGLGWCTDGTTA